MLEALPDAAEVRTADALEWDIIRQEAHSYLERLAERASELGVTADVQIAEGPVAHGIAASAAEIEADLVVFSTHGEGGAQAWALGGTAQKTLALARGAVLEEAQGNCMGVSS